MLDNNYNCKHNSNNNYDKLWQFNHTNLQTIIDYCVRWWCKNILDDCQKIKLDNLYQSVVWDTCKPSEYWKYIVYTNCSDRYC